MASDLYSIEFPTFQEARAMGAGRRAHQSQNPDSRGRQQEQQLYVPEETLKEVLPRVYVPKETFKEVLTRIYAPQTLKILPRPCVPEETDKVILPSLYVPEEIVKEILRRIPVNSLFRFQCVNKLWKSIIYDILNEAPRVRVVFMKKNRRFICFHFMDYEGVVEEYIWRKSPEEEEEEEEDDDNDDDDYRVDSETSIRRYPWGKEDDDEDEDRYRCNPFYNSFVQGSCDGLLLVVVKTSFFLWNPATRYKTKVLELEQLIGYAYRPVTGLCYDSSIDDYKVVVGLSHWRPDYGGEFVIVASLKEKQWRRIEFPYQVSSIVTGPVVNGFVHWISCKCQEKHYYYHMPHVISFDATTEKFNELPMPETKNRSDGGNVVLGLGVLDGCLWMSHWDNESDIKGDVEFLVMKEYGVKESWTSMFKILNLGIPIYSPRLRPLLVMKKGEILLKMGKDLLMYNPRKKTCGILNTKIRWFGDGDIVVESLVSPNTRTSYEYEWIKEKHQCLRKAEGTEDLINPEAIDHHEDVFSFGDDWWDSNEEDTQVLDSEDSDSEFFSLLCSFKDVRSIRQKRHNPAAGKKPKK